MRQYALRVAGAKFVSNRKHQISQGTTFRTNKSYDENNQIQPTHFAQTNKATTTTGSVRSIYTTLLGFGAAFVRFGMPALFIYHRQTVAGWMWRPPKRTVTRDFMGLLPLQRE